jgi:hypothetical protein
MPQPTSTGRISISIVRRSIDNPERYPLVSGRGLTNAAADALRAPLVLQSVSGQETTAVGERSSIFTLMVAGNGWKHLPTAHP